MEIAGKKIFLTGGLGFIGSHIARKLVEKGADTVIIYDNYTTGNPDYVEGLENIRIVGGDIRDADRVRKYMEGCEIVVHQAAELEVFSGIENNVHECYVNVVGTLNVLNAAVKNGVKKLVYASSGGVYGQAKYLPEDEEHPLMPQWPYGVSKLAGEKYCQQYTQLFGLPTVSLRYSIVFGPHEWYGRVLTMFIKRALNNQPPVIFGSGTQRRDFVYVEDVVSANILAIENDDVNGDVFNIGGLSHVNVKDIAKAVISLINPKLEPIYDDPAPGEASKYQPERRRLPGELKDFILDIKKAREKLGYRPSVTLEEGLVREVEWVKNNPEVWDYPPRV